MNEALQEYFDDRFTKNIKIPEWQNQFRNIYDNLVTVYDVSPNFVKIMQKNNVFAWYNVADILSPDATKVIKEESDRYNWISKVKSSIMEVSNL